jgi:hypothetical protein
VSVRSNHTRSERGSGLLVVILFTALFSAIAIGAAVSARVEVAVSEQYRQSMAALFAADAAAEAVVAELRGLGDWSPVVQGMLRSGASQGSFEGPKSIPSGGTVTLCCGPGTASDRLAADMQSSAIPARRAILWRPFLWSAFDLLAGRTAPTRLFVVVWVSNDEEDLAGGSAVDTNGAVLVRAEAFERDGVRRIVELRLVRQPEGSGLYSEGSLSEEERRMRVAVLKWREVR